MSNAKRKTVNVEAMLARFNEILASDVVPKEAKIGICTAAEIMLMDANRYNGFAYLNMTWNDGTNRYDVNPDTEYNRVYRAKPMKY